MPTFLDPGYVRAASSHEAGSKCYTSLSRIALKYFGKGNTDQSEKDKNLSEDDRDNAKEEIQNLTKQYESQAADLAKAREKDVMKD